jgi:transmembrane sensor
MEADDNKPITELVGKYLAGEATPEEALRVDEWMNDPANKVEWQEMLKLWNLSGDKPIPATPGLSAAWAEIQSAIEKTRPSKVRRMIINKYAVAACLVGVMAILFFVISKKKNAVNTTSKTLTEIKADSLQNIHLPDGSAISMTKNSSIRYQTGFNVSGRTIQLEGESYFTIAHNAAKPFIISIGGLSIKVIGTAFNVRPVTKENFIEVQVQSGIVQMISPAGTIIVNKEQTGIYNTETHALSVEEGIDPNSMSYATKSFLFRDQPLSEVCQYLEKSFDTPVHLDETIFKDCRITAQFDNSSLSYILDVIAATVNFSYTIKNKEVFIQGKGCK